MNKSDRLLTTFRWDELLDDDAETLRRSTKVMMRLFHTSHADTLRMPPRGPVSVAIDYNIDKRVSALERGKELVDTGVAKRPIPTMVPTTLNLGDKVHGLRDAYLDEVHPSQELFAYNRLGKESLLNRRFAKHCVQALVYAYPDADVTAIDSDHEAKLVAQPKWADFTAAWAVVGLKAKLAGIETDERQAHVISRSTGAIDLKHPRLSEADIELINSLRDSSVPRETMLARKAALLELICSVDGDENGPVLPIIQSVYITQHLQPTQAA